jgi:probable HAF family extracellular repeat protein
MASLHRIGIHRYGIAVIAAAALAALAWTVAAPARAAENPASISRLGLDGSLDPGLGSSAARTVHPRAATSGNLLLSRGALIPVEDVPGAASTAYTGADDRGEFVGSYSDTGAGAPPFHGFLRDTRGRFTRFDAPGAVQTFPSGVNDRGQVVGLFIDAAGEGHGFVRDRRGDSTTIDAPGALVTAPHGINNRRQVVGFYADRAGVLHGFLRSDRSFATIDVPGATGTAAFDINDRGEIVGGYQDAQGRTHGFRLRRGVFATIDPPGAADVRCPGPPGCGPPGIPGFAASVPLGINTRGQVAGQYADAQGLHAYLLDNGAYKTIDPPGGSTVAADINDRGEILLPGPTGFFIQYDGTS